MNDTTAAPSKGLHIALWVVQVVVAGSFLLGGSFRAFAPMDVAGIEKLMAETGFAEKGARKPGTTPSPR